MLYKLEKNRMTIIKYLGLTNREIVEKNASIHLQTTKKLWIKMFEVLFSIKK